MSGTTNPPPAVVISATGITAPTFSQLLTWLQQQYQGIYGSDVYLGNDSQDGQLLAVFAAAWNGANDATVAVYNSFSPTNAQGTGLSSLVKINGLARLVPSYSNVQLTIVGQANTVITNGIASDGTNNWLLPASVTIPSGGSITVTATAQQIGAISSLAGTITTIQTPTRGWQSVTNAAAAVPGAPVEADGGLRQRQAASTAQPSVSVLDGLLGALLALPGIAQVTVYENDTPLTDNNGIPRNTISVVASGGNLTSIAQTILMRKTPGTGTYGTTTVSVNDVYGIPHNISFYEATPVNISGVININPLPGYTSVIGQEIIAAVVAALNASTIGSTIRYTRLYVPANLAGPYAAPAQPTDGLTFDVTSILVARGSNTPTAADVVIAFNEVAVSTTASWTLNVS